MIKKMNQIYFFHVGQPSPYEHGVRDTTDQIHHIQRGVSPSKRGEGEPIRIAWFFVALSSFGLLALLVYGSFWLIAGRPYPL